MLDGSETRSVTSEEFDERLIAELPWLRVRARSLAGSASEADDLLQDTVERALRHRSQTVSTLRPWLATIMRRIHLDRCRERQRHSHEEAFFDAIPGPALERAAVWAQYDAADLRAAAQQLKTGHRHVFELTCLRRLSYADVATQLGIPRSTVATRLLRARQALRRVLSESLVLKRCIRMDRPLDVD